MANAIKDGVQPKFGRQREPPANVAFAATKGGKVDGDHDGFVTSSVGPVDHFFDESPIFPHVHLEPFGPVGDRRDLFD